MTTIDPLVRSLQKELNIIQEIMDLAEELERLSSRRGRLTNSWLKSHLRERIEAVRALPDTTVQEKFQVTSEQRDPSVELDRRSDPHLDLPDDDDIPL